MVKRCNWRWFKMVHTVGALPLQASHGRSWPQSILMEFQSALHAVLLQSDGCALACGYNGEGQGDIPPLDAGVSYIQVSAGDAHTVLLCSDGTAVGCGANQSGACNIPPLDSGLSYTHVSAGNQHTVLLRSDGSAISCGDNSSGQCTVPPLDAGLSYTHVSAGALHTVLLRSDGSAVACGDNRSGQCNIPPLDPGLSYTQVSAGNEHTVLLRSDGCAVACGDNIYYGQCNIPPLDPGLSYTQLSAGALTTVLLRSDGSAIACGDNRSGQCNIPPLDPGLSYTQVSGGVGQTLLLRSDGSVVDCGFGCIIPPRLEADKSFVGNLLSSKDLVLQANVFCEDDVVSLLCTTLSGDELLRLTAPLSDLAWDIHKRIARELHVNLQNLQVVLPDGQLLAKVCRAKPETTIADLAGDSQHVKRRRHDKSQWPMDEDWGWQLWGEKDTNLMYLVYFLKDEAGETVF